MEQDLKTKGSFKISQETLKKINTIAVLEDVQQQLLLELAPEFRFSMKVLMKNCLIHMRRFIKEMDRIYEKPEQFGETADEIRMIIDHYCKEGVCIVDEKQVQRTAEN